MLKSFSRFSSWEKCNFWRPFLVWGRSFSLRYINKRYRHPTHKRNIRCLRISILAWWNHFEIGVASYTFRVVWCYWSWNLRLCLDEVEVLPAGTYIWRHGTLVVSLVATGSIWFLVEPKASGSTQEGDQKASIIWHNPGLAVHPGGRVGGPLMHGMFSAEWETWIMLCLLCTLRWFR